MGIPKFKLKLLKLGKKAQRCNKMPKTGVSNKFQIKCQLYKDAAELEYDEANVKSSNKVRNIIFKMFIDFAANLPSIFALFVYRHVSESNQ